MLVNTNRYSMLVIIPAIPKSGQSRSKKAGNREVTCI
jgi:hypothetical protein